jgi:hypothetical protein
LATHEKQKPEYNSPPVSRNREELPLAVPCPRLLIRLDLFMNQGKFSVCKGVFRIICVMMESGKDRQRLLGTPLPTKPSGALWDWKEELSDMLEVVASRLGKNSLRYLLNNVPRSRQIPHIISTPFGKRQPKDDLAKKHPKLRFPDQ